MSATARTSGDIAPATAVALSGLADYAPGSIVSRTIAKSQSGTLTMFAFDEGQGLSEHSAPFDAYVLVVAGTAEIVIGGVPVTAGAGDMVRMPANVPHSLNARERFKMLLVMIKG